MYQVYDALLQSWQECHQDYQIRMAEQEDCFDMSQKSQQSKDNACEYKNRLFHYIYKHAAFLLHYVNIGMELPLFA